MPPAPTDSVLHGLADQDPEQAALTAAALLSIGRRAGATVDHHDGELPDPESTPSEVEAPAEAIQLLELLLTGNAGPGSMSIDLVDRWFQRCSEAGVVIPHRLLVTVLDNTTVRSRPLVAPVLGHRGVWLARQRNAWSWVEQERLAKPTINADTTHGADPPPLDAFLEMHSTERAAAAIHLRLADAGQGRQLIADGCQQLDANSRARLLECLAHNLGPDDEDLLEAALDDRSKNVRAVALELLEQLPGSARSARLAQSLEPLVSRSGLARMKLQVQFPDAPTDDQLRDVSPAATGVIEQQWFDALVAGAPLDWWEQHLDATPAKIVAAKLTPEPELISAWTRAAQQQKNVEWATALFERTHNPALSTLIGDDASAAAFLNGIATSRAIHQQVSLLANVAGPWDKDFSAAVLDWGRNANNGKGAQGRMNQIQSIVADRMDPAMQDLLTNWLEEIRGDELAPLQRVLRNLIQQLSFRISIDKAFQ